MALTSFVSLHSHSLGLGPPPLRITYPVRRVSPGQRIVDLVKQAPRQRSVGSIGLRDDLIMPYVSPIVSPSSSWISSPVCSPRDTRPPSCSSHWNASSSGGSTPPRRHSRTHSHDFLNALSPPPIAQIFLQPASPSPRDETNGVVIGAVPPSSAAAALNASHDAPPRPISPRNSPSAQRLQLRATTPPLNGGSEAVSPISEVGTCWPEGDSTADNGSPVASTSALPPVQPYQASGISPSSTQSLHTSPPKLHLRGAAARSKSSPGLPASALRKSMEKIAAERRTVEPKPAPMIRKKSGELVRSSLKGHSTSSSRLATLNMTLANEDEDEATPVVDIEKRRTRETRAKSLPATPTAEKHVLFDDHLEHIKLFRSEQRPTAVSRTGSPTETETEEESEGFPFPAMANAGGKINLRVPDLPTTGPMDDDWRDVMLEKLEMSIDQRNLRGTVLVRNLSLHKRVVVRFTVDDWQTVSEVAGEYVTAHRNGAYDRWAFTIKLQDMLARIESTNLLLAVRYSTDGRELWDSNHGRNYHVTFKRDAAPPATRKQMASSVRAAQTQRYNFIEGSKQSDRRLMDLQSTLERLADDYDDDDVVKPVRLQPAAAPSSFSTRYDFGTAFKAGRQQAKSSTLLANPFFHPESGAGSPSASPIMSAAMNISTAGYIPVSAPPPLSPLSQPLQPIYSRRDANGIIATDYGMPGHVIDGFPAHHRPPTPPDEDSGSHSPYHRSGSYDSNYGSYDGSTGTPRGGSARFNSFPPSRSVGNAGAEHLNLLLGPRRSTNRSPPPGSPSESLTPSESTTPLSDAGDASPPQLRGSYSDLPGLMASARVSLPAGPAAGIVTSRSQGGEQDDGQGTPTAAKVTTMRDLILSPSSSIDTTQSNELGSPGSPRDGSPPSSTTSSESSRQNIVLEDEVPTYSNFLERYCWHNQSSQPSALGLTDVPRHLLSPQPRSPGPSFYLGSNSPSGASSPVNEENHHVSSMGEQYRPHPLHNATPPIISM